MSGSGIDSSSMRPSKIGTDPKDIFIERVIHFIKTRGGIASMGEVYDVAKKVWGNLIWSNSKLIYLRQILIDSQQVKQIDISIPNAHPVAIYEGHHKVKATTFFVLPSQDKTDSIARAQALVQDLTNRALALEKEKKFESKKKNQFQQFTNNENQPESFFDTNQINTNTDNSKSNSSCKNYIFIGSRPNQSSILHQFLASTFQTQTFSSFDIISHLTVDLFLKIIIPSKIPQVFIKEPLLRQLLVSNLPEKYLNFFHYNKSQILLNKILKYMTNDVKVLQINLNNKYSLKHVGFIHFPNSFPLKFNLLHLDGIKKFWRAYELIELYESMEPTCASSFIKHYSLRSAYSNPFISKIVQKDILPLDFKTFPYNFFSVERFLSKVGYNWIYIKPFFTSSNYSKDPIYKSMLKTNSVTKFCSNLNSPSIETEIGIQKHFHRIDTFSDDNFQWISQIDSKTALVFLTAISDISTGNVLILGNRPWIRIQKLISQYCKEPFNRPVQEVFVHLMKYPDYSDFFNEVRAFFLQYSNMNFRSFFTDDYHKFFPKNSISQTVSELNKEYRLTKLGQQMPPFLGELVERLKVVLLSRLANFSLSSFCNFLFSVDSTNNHMREAYLYLKLTGFFYLAPNSGYKFNKAKLPDLSPTKGLSHYNQLFFAEKLAQSHDLDSLNISNVFDSPSSLFYMLMKEDQFCIDFNFDNDSLQTYLLHVKSFSRFIQQMLNYANESLYTTLLYLPYPRLHLKNNGETTDVSLKEGNSKKTPQNTKSTLNQSQSTYSHYPTNYAEILHQDIMRLFLLAYEISFKDIDVIMIMYSYLFYQQVEGASLEQIFDDLHFDEGRTIKCLHFLEEYEYVLRIRSTTILPYFVAGPFTASHLPITHYYTYINGTINQNVFLALSSKILEIINQNPGIELYDLSNKLTSLSFHDLLELTNILHDDDIISIKNYEIIQPDLFSKTYEIPIQNVDNYLYSFYVHKTLSKISQKYYKRLYLTKESDLLLSKVYNSLFVN